MPCAIVAMIMYEKLEILHVTEEARGLDHLQALLRRGLLCHLDHKPHEVSHIVWLAHPHTSVTQYPAFLSKCVSRAGRAAVIGAGAAWIESTDGRI